MSKKIISMLFLAALVGLVLTGCGNSGKEGNDSGQQAAAPARLNIATATSGGAFYASGLAAAQLLTQTTPYDVSCSTSSGSMENVTLLANGESNIVVQQSDVFIEAVNGTGNFEGDPHPKMRMLCPILSQQYNILVRNGSGINSLADWQGKNIVVGAAGSGSAITTERILAAFDVSLDQVNGSSVGFTEGVEAMRNGLADAMICAGAAPVSTISDALVGNSNCSLYEMTEEEMNTLLADYSFLAQMDIAANAYPGQDKPVRALGHIGFLAVNDDLDEEVVYNLVKSLYENKDQLFGMYIGFDGPAFNEPKAIVESMEAAGVQLHPGAERAMKELGLI